MKVKAVNESIVFQPITVELTFETKEEFEAFYQVTNWSTAVQQAVCPSHSLPISKTLTTIWNELRKVH